ncbi:hypothetical protein FOA52_008649 [Chlamydomonas sp. UWO 241]|nr:hypothetical protein FOA52_008649 [Chlamydomonas sp. UWO 241]
MTTLEFEFSASLDFDGISTSYSDATTTLEFEFSTSLDFGGIRTSEAEAAIKRASKGGLCSPGELQGAVSLFTGADNLRRQINMAARTYDASGRDSPIAPLLAGVATLTPAPGYCAAVKSAIDDEGKVVDSASEALGAKRMRVRQLTQRLSSLLRGYGVGEVSEQGGRLCVAVISGSKMPPGSMVLGSSPGGSMLYVEPAAAVPQNNELGGARAEAESAEEEVLYTLSGRLMGVQDEAEQALRVVGWLDALSAKARYGVWIDGTPPVLVPWTSVFHARGEKARAATAKAAAAAASQPSSVHDEDDEDGPGGRYMVRLRALRHPLLYGAYLKKKRQLEVQAASEGGGGAAGRRARQLSSRREEMMSAAGVGAAPVATVIGGGGGGAGGGGGGGAGGAAAATAAPESAAERLAALRPPRPVDLLVRRDVSVVVVTGPNTGGKTAAMKALGLCALMARCGLPLPAAAPPSLPAFSAVLADIGDEQSLTANLSTFSGHLRRIQALRAEADGKALLLLDELGTGTDPTEGAALGVALLRRLVQGGHGNGALTVATTHHSIMTGLKFEDPRFENASVEFDEVALAPTYKLLWGIPGRSNALNIAARLGMDPSVIEAARMRLDTGASAADAAIAELEVLRSKSERAETALSASQRRLKQLKAAVDKLDGELEAKRAHLGRARQNSLFETWLKANARLKFVKELQKKSKQGRLPPGQTIEKVLAANAAPVTGRPGAGSGAGGGGTSSDEEEEAITSSAQLWREVERLSGARPPSSQATPGEMAAAAAASAARQQRQGGQQQQQQKGQPRLGGDGPRIEDLYVPDIEDVFDELAGKFESRMGGADAKGSDERIITQVISTLENMLAEGAELDAIGRAQTAQAQAVRLAAARAAAAAAADEEAAYAALMDEAEARVAARVDDGATAVAALQRGAAAAAAAAAATVAAGGGKARVEGAKGMGGLGAAAEDGEAAEVEEMLARAEAEAEAAMARAAAAVVAHAATQVRARQDAAVAARARASADGADDVDALVAMMEGARSDGRAPTAPSTTASSSRGASSSRNALPSGNISSSSRGALPIDISSGAHPPSASGDADAFGILDFDEDDLDALIAEIEERPLMSDEERAAALAADRTTGGRGGAGGGRQQQQQRKGGRQGGQQQEQQGRQQPQALGQQGQPQAKQAPQQGQPQAKQARQQQQEKGQQLEKQAQQEQPQQEGQHQMKQARQQPQLGQLPKQEKQQPKQQVRARQQQVVKAPGAGRSGTTTGKQAS